jgi:pyruvate,orthophosphate dikinase
MTPGAVSGLLADAGFAMPADPMAQVAMAVRTVFESWQGPRATSYREIEGIDPNIGTAATVQAMVFGNLGDRSGTGVAFSRNPTTGAPGLVGDFLVNAQGEDVVAGEAMTQPLSAMQDRWPDLYSRLTEIAATLEAHYRDMVDLEFTVEDGQLWLLQTRRGKRSPIAAFRAAIDMAEDPTFDLDRNEAVRRCERYFDDPPTISDESATTADAAVTVIAAGLGASPGMATGVLCCDPDRAVALKDQGMDVILARQATSPADVHGMAAAKGIFTTLGGQVSHAALVAREWGLPAVVGAAEATVNHDATGGSVVGPAVTVTEGDTVTIDGDSGTLLLGAVAAARAVAPEVEVVKRWAEEQHADSAASATGGATAAGGLETQAPASTMAADAPPLAKRVLHALRIKGMLTAPAAAAICATDEATVEAELGQVVDQGFANYMEPRQMWLITPEGRAAHPDVLAEMIDGLDLDGLPYQRFLELNDDFKLLCTDWQLRNGEPNDHTDEAYDAGILERLGVLDDEAQPIVAAIGSVTTWMAPYGQRLAAARQRLSGGDQKALTGVMCDSYHDVWMELHEDLILTQGIDRAAEGST